VESLDNGVLALLPILSFAGFSETESAYETVFTTKLFLLNLLETLCRFVCESNILSDLGKAVLV